jgi:phthiocerol/phenolphthiocerol synthesis type-I polyketide synthase E
MNTGLREDHVAIVGMAGRFPGAADLDRFWRNLVDGVESIRFFSDEELRATGVPDDDLRDPSYVKAAAPLDDMDGFDAAFFGSTPRETEIRDPQHRLFLEVAFTALEHAGYHPARHGGAIGVFGGAATNRYAELYVRRNPAAVRALGLMAVDISNHGDYLATTTSYKLGLSGPSLTVATACSTSLVAVHLACQSLRNGECDLALAGGVEVELPPVAGYYWLEGGIFSPDGHCRAFDARAAGTIFGSGVGVVALKRLGDAVADGDTVHAVIRGSAINNDGADKVGFTAPGVQGQEAVIAEALGVAEVDASTISYVEAHGTGTALGDPIEIEALTRAFQAHGAGGATGYCAIGSVKTNVGHLGPAAGVTGLIKTVLAMRNRMLPPSLHFERPNPRMDMEHSPFRVNVALTHWEPNGTPRRAGVSSFGIGGTNAHAVLEEPPEPEPSGPSRPSQLLLVSARTATALDAATANLAAHLAADPTANLADVAYTLQVGRKAHPHRRALVCDDVPEAADALGDPGDRRLLTGQAPAAERAPVFLFPGQGAQHAGMAGGLYDTEPRFRDELDRCAALLRPHLGFDLRDAIFAGAPPTAGGHAALDQTFTTQPALFAVEYALARLLRDWGVEPQAMLGHSIGEYLAACLAEVFSLEDALALVAARGALMQRLPAGSMLAVPVAEAQLLPLLGDDLDLAAVNAPALCVVSGPHTAVDAFQEFLAAQGIQGRRLHTSHAFHSRMMDPILDAFAERVAAASPRPPRVPFVSNVSGTWITDAQATDPTYWAAHLRSTVRFADGVELLLADAERVPLEVGPGQTLTTLLRQRTGGAAPAAIPTMRHPKRRQADPAALLQALGRLWLAGVAVDWESFWGGERRRRVPLPTYPFERRRFWVDPDPALESAARPDPSPKGRLPLRDSFFVPVWKEAPAPLRSPAAPPEASRWLLFGDPDGPAAPLAARLADGRELVTVAPGGTFAQVGPGAYRLRPGERADYDALVEALRAGGDLPATIVHAWTLPRPDPAWSERQAADAFLERGFYSVLLLAQAIAKHYGSTPVELVVLSSNMQRVTGDEPLDTAKAAVLGPCKLLPKELPTVRCRSVDVALPAGGAGQDAALAERLVAELTAGASEPLVAYRGSKRWRWDFEAVALEDARGYADRLRERGVYLITGGLGGIGMVLAEELARAARARLVLVNRSPFPPRDDWPAYLREHGQEDRTARVIAKLLAIEELGGEVLVQQADVADEGQLRAVLARVEERFGALDGVIHAAGVPAGGMLAVRTPAAAAEVLAPKVDGTLALASLLAGRRLDFLVLCSSITAISGDFGLFDYCGANAFLDAFAASRADDGCFTVAIDWAAWREVGMAEETDYNAPAAFRELQSGARYQPAGHPLLDRRVLDATGDIVFSTMFEPDASWVLDEHRMDGLAILPGTSYLEMVRGAVAEACGAEAVELRDVVFLGPLRVEGRREVRTILRPAADGWDWSVVAASTPNGAGVQWDEHARGSARALPAVPAPVHDLAAIRARCGAGEVVPRVNDGSGLVTVGPRWSSLQQVLLGDGEQLALLELPPAFEPDLPAYALHPALLDNATAFAQVTLTSGHYLPFAYGRVTARAPLPRRFYSHIRRVDDGADMVTCDIHLLDEDGAELAAVNGFVLRRVDGPAMLASLRGGAGAAADGGAPPAAPAADGGETRSELDFGIHPAEGVEALRRILAARVGPEVVVCPEGLGRKIARTAGITQQRVAEDLAAVRLATTAAERTLDTPYAEPSSELEATLAGLWQEALGIAKIGVDDDFFELGGNSLVAVQLASRMRDHFQTELAIAVLFDNPTVRSLATVVEAALLEKVEALSEEEAAALLVDAKDT